MRLERLDECDAIPLHVNAEADSETPMVEVATVTAAFDGWRPAVNLAAVPAFPRLSLLSAG